MAWERGGGLDLTLGRAFPVATPSPLMSPPPPWVCRGVNSALTDAKMELLVIGIRISVTQAYRICAWLYPSVAIRDLFCTSPMHIVHACIDFQFTGHVISSTCKSKSFLQGRTCDFLTYIRPIVIQFYMYKCFACDCMFRHHVHIDQDHTYVHL